MFRNEPRASGYFRTFYAQDLALMQMTKVNGEYEMKTNVIVTGFTAPVDSVLVDNKLYVVENRFMGTPGAIYELTFPVPAK